MQHPRAEVFWQVTHHRDRQDDKCQGGIGMFGIDWAVSIKVWLLTPFAFSKTEK